MTFLGYTRETAAPWLGGEKQPIRATKSYETPPPACKLASHSAVSANTHIHKCTHSMMSSSPWEIETVNTVVCIRGVSGEMKIHNKPLRKQCWTRMPSIDYGSVSQ